MIFCLISLSLPFQKKKLLNFFYAKGDYCKIIITLVTISFQTLLVWLPQLYETNSVSEEHTLQKLPVLALAYWLLIILQKVKQLGLEQGCLTCWSLLG